MEIYLIRHTKPAIMPGVCYGQTDVELEPTFPLEATQIRDKLKGVNFDAVFSSPLLRCTQLAELLYSDYSISPLLAEMHFGKWEGWTWDDIFHDKAGKEWMDNYLEIRCPNGESFLDLKNRIIEFFESISIHGYSRIAVFTHAGVIRVVKGLCENIQEKNIFSKPLQYGEIYIAKINDLL
jgi:alpha-ribazole phosphatase